MAIDLGIDPLPILRLKLVEKAAVGGVILVLIAVGYWYFWFGDRQIQIESLESKLQKQGEEIAHKQEMLAQLDELRARYAELEKEEHQAMRELPSSGQIPSLLSDISLAGTEQGLEFLLFKPEKEVPMGFYAEVPISLEVLGPYHAIARFMDTVAKFSRIVNISDLEITPKQVPPKTEGAKPKEREAPGQLVAKAKATTYRFMDPQEQKAFEEARKAKEKEKKKK